MSATFTEVLPAAKSSPHAAINWTPGTVPGTGHLTIANKRAAVRYLVAAIPTAWAGRGFQFDKPADEPGTDAEAESYAVFCGRAGATCECKGFLRWRTPCKHILAAQALIDNRWI